MKNINKYISFLFALLILLTISYKGNAQKSKEKLQEEKKILEADITYTNKLLAETKKNKKVSLNQIAILNNKIKQREELISNINSELGNLESSINQNKSETERLNENLKELKQEYAKMIVFAYKNRNSFSRLMFIFASSDFNQAFLRLKYLQQYTRYRKSQAQSILKTGQLLTSKISEMLEIKTGKTQLLTKQEGEKLTLAQEKQEKSTSVKELQAKEKELLKTIRKKEKESAKLKQAIEAVIAEEIKKAIEKKKAEAAAKAAATAKTEGSATKPKTTTTQKTQQAKTTTENAEKVEANLPMVEKKDKPEVQAGIDLSSEEMVLSKGFVSNKGKLPWPVKGVVVSTFGKHPHPVLSGITTQNNGIDISTSFGAKAYAVFEGKVTGVIYIPGANKAVIIRHGDYLTVYSNLTEVYVKTGETVKTKQEIGLIYTDAEESKTELHFEVWKGKVLTDPIGWLSAKK